MSVHSWLLDINQGFIIKTKIFHVLVILIEKECLLLQSEIVPQNNLTNIIMIDKVRVTYGSSVGEVSFNELVSRVSALVSNHHVDFDLRVCKTSITISVYPFKYKDAKEISETDGAEIMRSLIYLCQHCIDGGILWSVEMATALPF